MVATSGISPKPICIDEKDALIDLQGLADVFSCIIARSGGPSTILS